MTLRERWRSRFGTECGEGTLVVALTAVALLPRLLVFPFAENWFGDAVVRSELGQQWASMPHYIGSYRQGCYQFGPLHIYLLGVMHWLWSTREHASRLVSLLAAAFTVWPLFVLTRSVFSRRHAVIACLAFALWGMHIQFSTTAASEALGVLCAVSGVAAFAVALAAPTRVMPWVGSGLLLTLGCAVRYDVWMLLPLMAGIAGWHLRGTPRLVLSRVLLWGAAASLFPLLWLWGNWADTGDALYAVRDIDAYHRKWFAYDEAGWGEPRYRLINFFFWPLVALGSLSPLVAVAAFMGAARAWRTRPQARWLLLLIAVPMAYFTVRSTFLSSFAPLSRFTSKEIALLLPFVGLGLSGRWERPLSAFAFAFAVVWQLSVGAFTFRRDGKYQDLLRPISPVSTQARSTMATAELLKRTAGADGGLVALDQDAYKYRDLTVAYFSGLPEAQLARYRWAESFRYQLAQRAPSYLLVIEGGALEREPGFSRDGRSVSLHGHRFAPVEPPLAPFQLYRRAE